MDACICHLCGEAMEPDVVATQGDTCEPCYFRHVIPTDVARRLDDGFRALQVVAAAALEALQESGTDEFQPPHAHTTVVA